jgi:EAL domain-containing protein (putative c-di-GMP-specific phosphodiesterase class I)
MRWNRWVGIAEGAMRRGTPAVLDRLRALKSIGVKLAVDDFGTGYSSLSYLRRFPLDILKIDRSFVEIVANGPEDSALARAIVRWSEVLHLTTIAEGIETTDQADIVREMGCDLGQGYLYAAPLDAVSVEQLLAGKRARGGGVGILGAAAPTRGADD